MLVQGQQASVEISVEPCCRPLAVVTRRCSAAVACGQIGGETCFTRKLEIKYSANTGECGAQGKHGHCTGQSVVGGRYTTELGTFYSCYHLNKYPYVKLTFSFPELISSQHSENLKTKPV